MRRFLFISLTLALAVAFTSTSPVRARQSPVPSPASTLALMPVPASVQMQAGRLPVTAAFTVATAGFSDDRLKSGIGRVMKRLQGRTGLTLDPAIGADRNATLVIQCTAAGSAIPAVSENESYTLDVSSTQVQLTAQTVVGALRGLETFLQLLDSDRDGYYLPAVRIQDQPRFAWRGLLIDVGRHFEPMEVLERNLDAMAAVKLNVLHWHLTEDQGFRVESRKFPKLHQMGSDGLYYTQDQVRAIVAYARERGIRVIPEFDIPGHSTSWLVGYPELGSAPGPYQIERKAGVFEPALDPTREQVYTFLDGFLGEMATLFPDSYMHIGGDENEGRQWDRNQQIQAFKREKGLKDNHALQAYFNQRLLKILQAHGKRMIGWDEILQPELPKDAMIQSWRGTQALADAARRGYDGILSNGYYIDLIQPASQHYRVDPIPANTTLTPEEARHVLGGEATMWGEYVGPETIDSRIWPRTAAIAERLWSPRDVADVDDMYRRLSRVSIQLEELGLTHERNVPVLLRRIAGTQDIGPLVTLTSVVEPVKQYERGKQRPATMLTPLTGLVDAARPDSQAARQFGKLVDALLLDRAHAALHAPRIRAQLGDWRDAAVLLPPLMDRAPALHEATPLVKDLAAISAIGLEAIAYLSDGTLASADWRTAALARLDDAAKPKAALELVIVASVKKLVEGAAR